jgi:hypothetical protein
VPPDVRKEQHANRDRKVDRVARGGVVDRVDVAAGEVADTGPDGDPQRGADRVEGKELRPANAADPGDDPVRLAQALDEPGDDDNPTTLAVEKTVALSTRSGMRSRP